MNTVIPRVGDIGWAMDMLKKGMGLISRKGWNGKGMFLYLVPADDRSDMTQPYVAMRTADGSLVPWLCSQTDLLAEDWIEYVESIDG